MLPDGPMTTTLCGSGNVYLADVHVIPGNSGSPIFIIPALGLEQAITWWRSKYLRIVGRCERLHV